MTPEEVWQQYKPGTSAYMMREGTPYMNAADVNRQAIAALRARCEAMREEAKVFHELLAYCEVAIGHIDGCTKRDTALASLPCDCLIGRVKAALAAQEPQK